MGPTQSNFLDSEIDMDPHALIHAENGSHGVVFTRPEVVEFMLDLAGYQTDRPLHRLCVLEPSCGTGSFLFPILERLLSAYRANGGEPGCKAVNDLRDAICAVELHPEIFSQTRVRLYERLLDEGFSERESDDLTKAWLQQKDFLLLPLNANFHYVIGNPPYIRQDDIPDALMKIYRTKFSTIFDRADLYIPFIEKSLRLLTSDGVLSFICADRWMKNRYGIRLREMVSQQYFLKYHVDMVGTPAFETEVLAYPAITVITRTPSASTRVAYRPKVDKESLRSLYTELTNSNLRPTQSIRELKNVVNNGEPWLFDEVDRMAIVRRLEDTFPLLEEAGCKVGIGVATGADKVFIGKYEDLDIEEDRKLRLITTRDIRSGQIKWQGLGIINPFNSDGSLVNLEAYPKLHNYLLRHEQTIRRRHVAKKNPEAWYRTIDRIYPERTFLPKLLIPDIKDSAHVVYEAGNYYPHHNLYYITSDDWDLRALHVVLISGVATLFVRAYSTIMDGGFLRFQAQYLRRIRLPFWSSISEQLQSRLIEAAAQQNIMEGIEAVAELYSLSQTEQKLLIKETTGNHNGSGFS